MKVCGGRGQKKRERVNPDIIFIEKCFFKQLYEVSPCQHRQTYRQQFNECTNEMKEGTNKESMGLFPLILTQTQI